MKTTRKWCEDNPHTWSRLKLLAAAAVITLGLLDLLLLCGVRIG